MCSSSNYSLKTSERVAAQWSRRTVVVIVLPPSRSSWERSCWTSTLIRLRRGSNSPQGTLLSFISNFLRSMLNSVLLPINPKFPPPSSMNLVILFLHFPFPFPSSRLSNILFERSNCTYSLKTKSCLSINGSHFDTFRPTISTLLFSRHFSSFPSFQSSLRNCFEKLGCLKWTHLTRLHLFYGFLRWIDDFSGAHRCDEEKRMKFSGRRKKRLVHRYFHLISLTERKRGKGLCVQCESWLNASVSSGTVFSSNEKSSFLKFLKVEDL